MCPYIYYMYIYKHMFITYDNYYNNTKLPNWNTIENIVIR